MSLSNWLGGSSGGSQNILGMRKIRQCLKEIGWKIDERLGDQTIGLHFNHAAGFKLLMITSSETSRVASLSVMSDYQRPTDDFDPLIAACLLERNIKMVYGGWRAHIHDGVVLLDVNYTVLTAALDGPTFKDICNRMVSEVMTFEHKLRQDGIM